MNFPLATSTEPPVIDNDHRAERDWANRLPKSAQDKLTAIRRIRDDARTLLEAAQRVVMDLKAPDGAYAEAARAHDAMVRKNRFVPTRSDDPKLLAKAKGFAAQVADAEQHVAALKVKIDEAVAVQTERSEAWQRASRLCTNVENWLEKSARKLREHNGELFIPDGQTPLAALDDARSLIAALGAERKRIEQVSMSLAEVKQRVRAFVEGRAARVSARGLIAHNGTITVTYGEEHDPFALLCWLEPDKVMRRLEKEAEGHLDGRESMSELDQARAMRANADRLLETERREEALIELLVAQGTVVVRRASADPRAVLGVE